MQNLLGTLVGKTVRLASVVRPNGGHALPGLVTLKIFPGYVDAMLRQLPQGVVMITGTNGKTTTTKMLVHLLQANGYRVITNSTGSNMVRGIASSLIKNADFRAKLPYDIAVFEVDEASTKQLVQRIKPRWVLALNVSRDQLDRFGEVDTIAQHVGRAMSAATEGVVTNAGDPHLAKIAKDISTKNKAIKVEYFGVASSLDKYFPSDYDLAAVGKKQTPKATQPTTVELSDFKGQDVTYKIGSNKFVTRLKLTGQHNFQNGAAALALAKELLTDVEAHILVEQLAEVSIAFGRGESYRLKNGAVVELVLVKNPASFRQALASYAQNSKNLMIAINDNIADGRDVSWLWDVDFSSLKITQNIITSGTRAADMALRLAYDEIKAKEVEADLETAVAKLSVRDGNKLILSTYTAMLQLYSFLNKTGVKVE